MQTRMVDLMKERDEATEAYALMELERREVSKSARDANEKWEERKQELMEFRERRDRWIHFLRRRISEGAGTGRRAEKEEGLLRRVLGKGMTLARAVVEAREQIAWEVEGIRVLLGHPAQNHTKNQGYTLVIFPKYTKNARIFLKTAYLE
eukprot:SAG11_NODE_3676_length_2293_cov_6.063810_1_plen_150_part_00